MEWLPAGDGYQVAVDGGTVVCRNAKGRQLRSVPASLRDDPAVLGLRQLLEWLDRHTAACRADVERWMVRTLPVPAPLLTQVWADEAWRTALTDLVVAGCDTAGRWDPDEVGFLRDVSDAGLGLVNLDGDSVRLRPEQVVIPHPVLIPDLADLQEFASELGVSQSVEQVFRQTWVRGDDHDLTATAVSEYAGGRFRELRHLTARATQRGYPVRGGYAVCRVFEHGQVVEARSWLGADDPAYETETGDLIFVSQRGTSLPLKEVGAVAWSEGTRMAAALYAGRVIEETQEVAA